MLVPKNALKKLLNIQYFAVLSSAELGQPYSNLIAFAASQDFKSLVFATNRNTRKYRNIIMNKKVSLLIDSRTNQSDDISTATAITVLGTAREANDLDSSLRSLFLKKHPRLKSFIEDTNTALVVVSVSQYIIAGFNKTREITIK